MNHVKSKKLWMTKSYIAKMYSCTMITQHIPMKTSNFVLVLFFFFFLTIFWFQMGTQQEIVKCKKSSLEQGGVCGDKTREGATYVHDEALSDR